jgi:hypothetical protein
MNIRPLTNYTLCLGAVNALESLIQLMMTRYTQTPEIRALTEVVIATANAQKAEVAHYRRMIMDGEQLDVQPTVAALVEANSIIERARRR